MKKYVLVVCLGLFMMSLNAPRFSAFNSSGVGAGGAAAVPGSTTGWNDARSSITSGGRPSRDSISPAAPSHCTAWMSGSRPVRSTSAISVVEVVCDTYAIGTWPSVCAGGVGEVAGPLRGRRLAPGRLVSRLHFFARSKAESRFTKTARKHETVVENVRNFMF